MTKLEAAVREALSPFLGENGLSETGARRVVENVMGAIELKDPVRRAVMHHVMPVAPETESDPWRMEPGDCQRALAAIWEAMKT